MEPAGIVDARRRCRRSAEGGMKERWRVVWGLAAGVVLVASAGAHSLLGWPQLRTELSASSLPADAARGLEIGWHFGGGAMLAFGVIVLETFVRAFRGRAVSMRAPLVIGVFYVAFGVWALMVSGLNPFFAIFVVPGAVLVLASRGRAFPASAQVRPSPHDRQSS
jgi:hypothetical protein